MIFIVIGVRQEEGGDYFSIQLFHDKADAIRYGESLCKEVDGCCAYDSYRIQEREVQ
jgi:hypothetical protein